MADFAAMDADFKAMSAPKSKAPTPPVNATPEGQSTLADMDADFKAISAPKAKPTAAATPLGKPKTVYNSVDDVRAAAMKGEIGPLSDIKNMLYGAGQLVAGGATAAQAAGEKLTGRKLLPESLVEGIRSGAQNVEKNPEGSFWRGAGYHGMLNAIPAGRVLQGASRLKTLLLGGGSNIAANVLDPTRSDEQRYGLKENAVQGATGALAGPVIVGATGRVANQISKIAAGKSEGVLKTGAKLAAAPVMGALSELKRTGQDIVMKVPGAAPMVHAVERYLEPAEDFAARKLQNSATDLATSVKNLEKNIELAKRTKVPLSAGQAAQDPGLAIQERMLRSTPDSNPALFPQRQHQIMAEELNKITDGAPESMSQLGKTLDARRTQLIKDMGEKANVAWKDVETLLPGDTAHTPNTILRLADGDGVPVGLREQLGIAPGQPIPPNIAQQLGIEARGGTPESTRLRSLLTAEQHRTVTQDLLKNVRENQTVADMKKLRTIYWEMAEAAKDARTGKDTSLSAAYKLISDMFNKEYEGVYGAISPKAVAKAKTLSGTEKAYRAMLRDYLGKEKRDIDTAATTAGNFLASLKNARGMDVKAFNLMWGKAPAEMKRDVFNYVFHQALDPRTGTLDRGGLKRIIKTLAPEVRTAFEKYRPQHLARIEGIAEQLDMEDAVLRAGKMPGSDTSYKLAEQLAKRGSHALGRVLGILGDVTGKGFEYGAAILRDDKLRSAVLEKAIVDPEYAKALLTKTLTQADTFVLQRETRNAIARAFGKVQQ